MSIEIHTLHQLDDPDVLAAVMGAGESQKLEFKTRLPRTSLLVRILASFANSQGGLLLVGFDESSGRVVDIGEPEQFRRQVEASLARLEPYPESISYGIVSHPDGLLGAVLIWPADRQPLSVDGKFYARRGDRTVQYPGSEHIRHLSMLPEAEVTPVPLRLSTAEIDEFLSEASEDIFSDLLVVPLMREQGFTLSRKGHRDKSLEFGQDLRAMKYQLPTGHWIYFAAQVKTGTIGYSPQYPASIDKILEQLRMAFNTKMTFWDTRSEHRPDHVYLIASGYIVEGARVYLRDAICDDRMKVLFWDKEQIVELCTTKGLPEGIQKDIKRYLENAVSEDEEESAG